LTRPRTRRTISLVRQSAQVLALMGVFLDVGIRGGVSAPLMAFALLFANSYFSVITPQGGSQNVIFVGNGYLRSASCIGWGC
jgi:DASS family divalent anion:Na+ symporter